MLKFIDLFCGAGGVTTGIEQALSKGKKIAEVIACVNHDPIAIESHSANHPDAFHFTEDIRTLNIDPLIEIVKRKVSSSDTLCLWASLECTNFSNAKGGLPRDADSRTLANDLFRYIDGINPDYILIENVQEFMSWGPLDGNGKPVSKNEGEDYIQWTQNIKSRGYIYDWRILNSADYGSHTSRKRYFGIFAKHGLPIQFPQPTHSKNPNKGFFGTLEKWRLVKEVLDFEIQGESIFKRKKPLSENTMKRIYAGLVKYVAGGKEAFITKYFSSHNNTKLNSSQSVDEPCPVITTQVRMSLVQPEFLNKYHGTGENILSVNDTCSTLSTKDRLALIQPRFIQKNYSGEQNHQSINQPAGSIVTNDKHSLVSCFLINRQYSNTGSSVDNPCFTLIASMNKRPGYLVQAEQGEPFVAIKESDSDIVKQIKEFMILYGIYDIRMRMLLIPELKRIQGFSEDYILKGNQSDQKKFIGNSVPPMPVRRLVEAIYEGIININRRVA